MNADYKIKISTGEIPLLFKSRAYRLFSEKKGIELDVLHQHIKLKDLPDLLKEAHECYCFYNKVEPEEIDGDELVDAIGGYYSPKVLDLYKLFVGKLINADPKTFEVMWDKVLNGGEEVKEKKKAVTKVLPGESSTNSLRKLA